ncbi:MAG: phenylacetate--CoA ligase [Defluviitaleaceae bacterium]|nr:phenylacetate--CoA ligase [Defluviitaleaceae bacterium]
MGELQFWNQEIEQMPREQLKDLQLTRLKDTVSRVYAHVPYYRDKMRERGVEPGDVKSLSDLRSLPFLTKQDLRDTYPYGLFAAPLADIVRIHASSGTTGKQVIAGYTRRDLDAWADCMARCLVMAGADRNSRVHVSYGYGLFTGGLGAHGGAERLGAMTIPASAGNTQRQITLLKDLGATVLCCTPSYALYLAEALAEMGYTKDDLSLEAGVFGAEPWTERMRGRIEDGLGLKAYDIYGLTEIMGPSVAQSCVSRNGLHVWEDCFIPEIIDPDTGENLPDGQTGELVITTINKDGMPLIRYRTRDITRLTAEPCECGRTHARMARLEGRTDDMLIIRGVNVFPSQIETVLLSSGEAAPHYQIIVERDGSLDSITVELEVSERMLSDNVKGMEELSRRLRSRMDSVLGLTCKIRLVEPKSIPRSEGKAKRVIDRRKME